MAYDASTHHLNNDNESASSVNTRLGQFRKYRMMRSSLALSCIVGHDTLVYRKATAFRRSGLAHIDRKRSFATRVRKASASIVLRSAAFLSTENKLFSAGVVSSPRSARTCQVYGDM
jgi:hypothetical protein